MNRRLLIGTMAALGVVWFTGCTKQTDMAAQTTASTQAGHEDPEGYYTCSMHPQVHQHEPGKCPICGMALIKVGGKNQKQTKESTHEIHVTDRQMQLAGISKYTVTKKDLIFTVPVSGRMLSSREVVFQVYESDLATVKSGLEFSGSSTSAPGDVIKGRIRQVDSIVDPSSRTVRVTGTLTETPKNFVSEGGFHGVIRSVAKDQIAIPEEAVLHTGQKNLVYLMSKEGTLKPVAVAIGKKTSQEYQVLSGLNVGDVISSGPNFLIDSEAKLRGGNDQTHH